MKNKLLYLNCNVLNRVTWNKSYGNKITHLLYGLNLANIHKLTPKIICKSELDDIFDLTKIQECADNLDIETIFHENSIFDIPTIWQDRIYRYLGINLLSQDIEDVTSQSKTQYDECRNFLENTNCDNNFTFKGHFWHYDLMPTQKVIEEYLSIKSINIEKIMKSYPTLQNSNSVAVHLRETDFIGHQRHIFKKPIVLDDDYYAKAIKLAKKHFGNDIEFHLFSDNMDRIENIFKNERYILHKDSAVLDWTALALSKNIIQSNSSFCWSASLFNKNFSIQPNGGYRHNYNQDNRSEDNIPYGFIMPFSEVIK